MNRTNPLFSRWTCAVISCGLMIGVVQADDKGSDPAVQKAPDRADKAPRAKKAKTPEQRAMAAKRQFARRDKNQDGHLSLDEFATLPKKLTDEAKIQRRKKAMNRQFKLRDANSDGKLSQEEFAKPIARKKPAREAVKKKARARRAAKKAKQAEQ